MLGVIDVGGGLRGIYGAGVFDFCMEQNIVFDYGIGISAGSANLASYLAGQRKRNWTFYYDYTFRKEYMSLYNLLYKGSYIDLDYVYSILSNTDGENPLDYAAFEHNPAKMIVVATDAKDGSAVYFDKKDIIQDNYDILKASCCIPGVCKPYPVNQKLYFDGALSDPVPVKKAFADGCDKVVLILTKPRDLIRTAKKDERLALLIQHRFPEAAKKLRLRAQRYNEGVAYAKELEKQGKVLILAPDDISGVDTLKKNKEALQRLYNKGIQDAIALTNFIEVRKDTNT